MDINSYINDKRRLIDKALDRYLPSAKTKPQVIHKAMRYAVFPGGKRIRPVLTLASFEACGGRGNKILAAACAIELIHTYTLIHDDLPCMDNDDYRRGRLSCHKKFNEALALLAGDALLTLAFELLSETGNASIVKEVSKAIGSCGTIGGQVVDIVQQRTENREQRTELDYIATRKTGELFRVAVKVGGMFEEAEEKKIEALDAFGKCIGFTFQLVDDLIDKDGYAKIYGAKHTENMAKLLTRKAKAQLAIFGNKGRHLLEIADLILRRKF